MSNLIQDAYAQICGDQREIESLREQVEKLTKERNAFQDQCIRLKNERAVENGQLAALAEQNAKQRQAIVDLKKEAESYGETWARCYIADFDRVAIDSKRMRFQLLAIAQERLKSVGEALSLPDLATPVLNKYRAEGMRIAAELVEAHHTWITNVAAGKLLRAKADELEQSK